MTINALYNEYRAASLLTLAYIGHNIYSKLLVNLVHKSG